MEVIVDELRKNNVYVDITVLSQHIHYILDKYQDKYNEMANRMNSTDLLNVFNEMNINSIGRVMAYLTLVYRMNISDEDTTREAVRLVVPVLRNITRVERIPDLRNITRVVRCIRRLCSGVGHALYSCNIS